MLDYTPSPPATLPLTATLDVRHRLRQQQVWYRQWQQKDHLLEQIIFEVDETRPAGEQRGLQAIT